MEAMLLVPTVCVIGAFVILLMIGAYSKFFRRDTVKENAIKEMVATHRKLQAEATALQAKADAMKSVIQDSLDRMPKKSQTALACDPFMMKSSS